MLVMIPTSYENFHEIVAAEDEVPDPDEGMMCVKNLTLTAKISLGVTAHPAFVEGKLS